MNHVLEHNEQPKSVYAFAKVNNISEAQFYKYFGSFDALEQHIFEAFFINTLKVLDKSPDYLSFDARNKLLSFYFTFFENLTANRSYVVSALKDYKNGLKTLNKLKGLRSLFTKYISDLNIETLEIKQESLEKLQHKSLQESAWIQLLMTLKFWLDDSSASFEKTDIFIEKSINASFDLIDVKPIKSVIDLGKFLFKEKMFMN
jgi:AcrR family transcriptional regulator